MTSGFPASIDDISPAGKTNATPQLDDHPNHHNLLADAIEKIERELGVNPSGAYADVAAALAAGGEVYEQPSAPASPSVGALWIDTDETAVYGPKWLALTQAAYDALTPKDPSTLYLITG